MKVLFYASVTKKFDMTIAEHIRDGIIAHGDQCDIVSTADAKNGVLPGCDVAICVGVKGGSQTVWDEYQSRGAHTVIIDKGYTRLPGGPLGTLYWRISVDHFQPLPYFQKFQRPDDRWKKTGKEILPWRRDDNSGMYVIWAGSSQKYCNWHNLGDATEYAGKVLQSCNLFTVKHQKLVYRPKPSWGNAVPLDDKSIRYSPAKEKLKQYFDKAHCVITFGSNAAVEAVCAGVPVIVIGDGLAAPVGSTSISDMQTVYRPSYKKRLQWAADMAYCQWSCAEMKSGEAWHNIRDVMGYLESCSIK